MSYILLTIWAAIVAALVIWAGVLALTSSVFDALLRWIHGKIDP